MKRLDLCIGAFFVLALALFGSYGLSELQYQRNKAASQPFVSEVRAYAEEVGSTITWRAIKILLEKYDPSFRMAAREYLYIELKRSEQEDRNNPDELAVKGCATNIRFISAQLPKDAPSSHVQRLEILHSVAEKIEKFYAEVLWDRHRLLTTSEGLEYRRAEFEEMKSEIDSLLSSLQ